MGMPVITTSQTTRFDAVTDIIQSVALEQAALSHILNAEGEKLQCMLASKCTSPEQILDTNDSVRSMVDSIAKLEMILQYKLNLFEGCLCNTCELTPKKEHSSKKLNCNCNCDDN
ncbi:MAG: hypothetical protein R3Y40_06495 [Eubacteriales bacterium]